MRSNLLAVALVVLGCESEVNQASPALLEVDLRSCKPAPGTTGSPNSIAEAVALANGLPQPATAACFLEALDRPLKIEATKSKASVQPAHGARSPRVFVFSGDNLIIAAAMDGEGRDLIEFGELTTPRRAVNGEIAFPVTETITEESPYDRVRNPEHENITSCFVCHDAERDEPGFPGGRSSLILRPRTKSLVPIESLQTEADSCDADKEPERCAMLHALVDWGPLEHRPFDTSLPTF